MILWYIYEYIVYRKFTKIQMSHVHMSIFYLFFLSALATAVKNYEDDKPNSCEVLMKLE